MITDIREIPEVKELEGHITRIIPDGVVQKAFSKMVDAINRERTDTLQQMADVANWYNEQFNICNTEREDLKKQLAQF